MEQWEYEIASYPVKEVAEEAQKEAGVIICDPRGVCLHKDMPSANREVFVKILNEQGNLGWELGQLHFDGQSAMIVCIWKRKKQFKQLEH